MTLDKQNTLECEMWRRCLGGAVLMEAKKDLYRLISDRDTNPPDYLIRVLKKAMTTGDIWTTCPSEKSSPSHLGLMFMAVKRGDTIKTNLILKIVYDWIEEFEAKSPHKKQDQT